MEKNSFFEYVQDDVIDKEEQTFFDEKEMRWRRKDARLIVRWDLILIFVFRSCITLYVRRVFLPLVRSLF